MRKKSRYIAAFIILIILLGAALAANVCIGSVSVPVSQVWDILTGEQADEVYRNIVHADPSSACSGRSCHGRRAGIVRIPAADLFP